MTTRRAFLKQGSAAAGAVALGCESRQTSDEAKEGTVAARPATTTLELMIGGLFLVVEDQRQGRTYLLAPKTGGQHKAHSMFLLFSKASKRPPQKLDRARMDFPNLPQGPVMIPSSMLDVNDVVTGKRLRLGREHIDGESALVQHLVTFGGGTLSVVTDECCVLGSAQDSAPFTVAGRIKWSCPVNAEALALNIYDNGTKKTIDDVAAESGRISLGLVNGVTGDRLPETVDELLDESIEYPGSWDHFKAFYQFWEVEPKAPGTCIRDQKLRNPSQCAPGRVAAE